MSKKRNSEISVNLKPMLSLREGEAFIIEADHKQATAYACRYGVKIATKKIVITDPKSMVQVNGIKITIIKQAENEEGI